MPLPRLAQSIGLMVRPPCAPFGVVSGKVPGRIWFQAEVWKMTLVFPAVEPYDSGMLDVGDGHRVYWETCGNPDGKPAVYLHGGPGSGSSPGARRYFDPDAYRVILFDQRGSGRSRPLASDPGTDLSTNTTSHLIADIEQLRQLHGIGSWTVLGISWGSTLGLAYAQACQQHVTALVLAAVGTDSRREVEWLTRDVGRIFPREWDRFASAVPETLRHLPLADAYATLVFDADPAVREDAAREWCAWEDAHISLAPGYASPASSSTVATTSAAPSKPPGSCPRTGSRASWRSSTTKATAATSSPAPSSARSPGWRRPSPAPGSPR
jgi:proline iminopeptidase